MSPWGCGPLFVGVTEMENLALKMPALDLFGEQVVIRRRSFEPRRRMSQPEMDLEQLAFIDILEMDDVELERLRAEEVITDDYIDWMREYLLKLTMRQLVHPQVSDDNWRDAMAWMMSDEIHPFSFRICCEAMHCDFEDVREATLHIVAKTLFN